MKSVAGILKVLFLTVITGGIYGAYWLFINLYKQPDYPGMSESEKAAGEAQNTIALTWLHFINR